MILQWFLPSFKGLVNYINYKRVQQQNLIITLAKYVIRH